MKKLSFILSGLLIAGSLALFSSCGENSDTEENNTQPGKEMADLILNYNVELYISSQFYIGKPVEIDMDKIAAELGVDKEALGAALNGEDGLDVEGFAIEGSTHADNVLPSNTTGYWGHWWDKDGYVKDFGDETVVYAKFYYKDGKGFLEVVQHPGHLAAGQEVKFIEALKYRDKRVAIVITAKGVDPAEIMGTIVQSNKLTVEALPDDTYSTVAVEGFDADAALATLGAGSWAVVDWLSTKADGSYDTEYSADNGDGPGFWYDMEGFSGPWGDNSSVFAIFKDGKIHVGQMARKMTAGMSVTINFSAIYGNKIVENIITVNIVDYLDPETAPEGEPVSIERDITLTKPYDDTWGETEPIDVREELRQAFKMTTHQIFQALESGEMKMWVGEIGNMADEEGNPDYTGDAPGWWLNSDGAPVGWGDEAMAYVNLSTSDEELSFYGGNHPSNCPPQGLTIKTKYIIEYNGTTATFNVTFDITAAQ